MFRKLRNKFILTNLAITTAILVLAFSGIFIATEANRANRRELPPELRFSEMAQVISTEIEARQNEERATLIASLIMIGLMTEAVVLFASWYIAEQSIKPVKEAYESQREFIANASHELKTPIAAIRANFEALEPTEQPWTENIEAELDHANDLVLNLLALAKADAGAAVSEKKEVDLVAMAKRRVRTVKSRLGEKTMKVSAPESVKMRIVEADAVQILDCLLDNAIKYSDREIRVVVCERSVSVENDGKKIPADKLPHVFERFYQVNKTANGSGLGLAIAKSVADRNGWRLTAKSGDKTRFTLSF